MPRLRALAVLTGLGAIVVWLRRGFLVATVNGMSMAPTYRHGDRLLAVRRTRFCRLRSGDVVVCRLPCGYSLPAAGTDALLVKRIAAVAGESAPQLQEAPVPVPAGAVYVLGDAPDHSLDSREFGSLPEGLIIGRVLRRLSIRDPGPRG